LKFVVYGPAPTNFFFDAQLDRLCCGQIGVTSYDKFLWPGSYRFIVAFPQTIHQSGMNV
jgi:hypothetical protein